MEWLRVQASPEVLCCVLEQDTLLLVQPKKAHPNMTEKLLTGM